MMKHLNVLLHDMKYKTDDHEKEIITKPTGKLYIT